MDMMKEFISRGYEVYALANEDEHIWEERFLQNEIIYKCIPLSRNGLNPFQDIKTKRAIKALLECIKPDKVFSFQAKTVIYGTMAANNLGITEVYPLIAGVGSIFISNSIKNRILRIVMASLYRKAIKKCPVVFFQNRDDELLFRKYGIINRQRVVLIHGSGVNTETFKPTSMPETISFLCISRLIRDKGVIEYLEACKRIIIEYPKTRCLLVGPYDTNPSAIKPEELKPFLDAGIEYFGQQEDVRPFFRMCSVFVLPSYREGTPKTNLEAMACGRPVITTNAPGCKETVVNEKNGFLVPIKDSDAIFEKMKWFVENPETVHSMGKTGRQMAEELFDVRLVNQSICKTMGL